MRAIQSLKPTYLSHPEFTKKCLCGCGMYLPVHRYVHSDTGHEYYTVNNFMRGHNRRGVGGFNSSSRNPQFCACGCANTTKESRGVYGRYIKGHENIGRTPWNKGGHLGKVSRLKMSHARLGKEPANKVSVNLEKLYQLYVLKKKSARDAAQVLRVTERIIKNRILAQGWSRSTKETCSLPAFREKMRELRIKVLSSQKAIKTPNKLERLVYDAFDKRELSYVKQAPLFGKFVVDILFPEKRLVVEIFGRYWHELPVNQKKDYSKKRYLEKCGYVLKVLWDDQIKRSGIDSLLDDLIAKYNLE